MGDDHYLKELRVAAETTTEEQIYGYTIDGGVYPEPESLTMDDHRIIKRYTGWNFRQITEMPGDILYVDQDGITAMMHISYRHVHEEMSFDEIAKIVGRVELSEAQKTLQKASEVDVPLDPESTLKPDESSPRRKPSTTEPSGNDSEKSSENSDESLATTGISESATSFRQLAQVAAEESAS